MFFFFFAEGRFLFFSFFRKPHPLRLSSRRSIFQCSSSRFRCQLESPSSGLARSPRRPHFLQGHDESQQTGQCRPHSQTLQATLKTMVRILGWVGDDMGGRGGCFSYLCSLAGRSMDACSRLRHRNYPGTFAGQVSRWSSPWTPLRCEKRVQTSEVGRDRRHGY